MTQIQKPSIAQVEHEFIEAWSLMLRLKRQLDRSGVDAVLKETQRKVERMMGYMILNCGHSCESLAKLTGSPQPIGDACLQRMTIGDYLAHYRGFPVWFQKDDAFHLVSQAAEHTPRLDHDSTGQWSHVEYWRALDGQFCTTMAASTALVDLGGVTKR